MAGGCRVERVAERAGDAGGSGGVKVAIMGIGFAAGAVSECGLEGAVGGGGIAIGAVCDRLGAQVWRRVCLRVNAVTRTRFDPADRAPMSLM
jgi:hypothetical protein